MLRTEQATLGGGCFWCLEALYQEVKGVLGVVSGYAGGEGDKASYEQISSGLTGYAEVNQVTYDPAIIAYLEILEIFFAMHDPTTLNRQGHDVGPQYRSIILYHNEGQQKLAAQAKAEAAQLWDDPIVTEVVPLTKFFSAEDYHQNFYRSRPEVPYCQVIINPKLQKFRQKFAAKLKN